jgi:hypothetical protein
VRRCLIIGIALVVVPWVVKAQWLNVSLPGIPRTSDGKPNLAAPAPRTFDGKLDLTGIWAAVGDRGGGEVVRNAHGINIAVDLAGGAPFTPWAKAIFEARRKDQSRDIPTAKCLPAGIPPDMLRPTGPFKIVQTPGVTIILLEEFNNWRQIFTDGRAVPTDPQPAWFGYSVGKWEGETLVVETSGFNDRTWLDGLGTPHSEVLRLTERFRRADFGHLEIEYTFDDSKAFTKSWSAKVKFMLQVDTELLDSQCENEKDLVHLFGK